MIDADGKRVVVKLMDDSWILNRCVSDHPFVPNAGIVWTHSDHCSRLPVPGDELPEFMRQMRAAYGNCAAVAWHGEVALGHIVFLPRAVARERRATGWEHFGAASEDEGTLVVINLAFCSLSGHEFRRKGVGKALMGMMLEWAREAGWKRLEVYGAGGGLFPGDWLDACIPPMPFWEGCGFRVFARHGEGALSDEALRAIVEDDPRGSAAERRVKADLAEALRVGAVEPERYAYAYDLGRSA